MTSPNVLRLATVLGAASISAVSAPQMSAQVLRPGSRIAPVTTSVSPIVRDTGSTTTAATVPVGFTSLTITPATSATFSSATVVSVPFYNAAAYAAIVNTVPSATQFTVSGVTWTAGQFTTTPYLVHFKSGSSVGRYFLITANDATSITVAPHNGNNLSTVAAGTDTFEIVPANTLASLFGSTSVAFQSGATADVADNIYLWNGSSFSVYYYNGTNWKLSGNLSNENATILYPDEGIFVLRRSTAALTLTFAGTVSSTTEKSDVPGPGSTFVSNRFPVDTTLTAFGFQNLASWKSGSTADVADNVYQWNGSSWTVFYYNGSNWKASGSLSLQDSAAVPAGSALFVVRQSSATGSAGTLSQALPYSL